MDLTNRCIAVPRLDIRAQRSQNWWFEACDVEDSLASAFKTTSFVEDLVDPYQLPYVDMAAFWLRLFCSCTLISPKEAIRLV